MQSSFSVAIFVTCIIAVCNVELVNCQGEIELSKNQHYLVSSDMIVIVMMTLGIPPSRCVNLKMRHKNRCTDYRRQKRIQIILIMNDDRGNSARKIFHI